MGTHRATRTTYVAGSLTLLVLLLAGGHLGKAAEQNAQSLVDRLGVERGICLVLGAPDADLPVRLARASGLLIYVQTDSAEEMVAAREAADRAGMLGTRIYVERGAAGRIHLADNLADGAIVARAAAARDDTTRRELLRVVHPGAKALLGNRTITKPQAEGADDWSHPYHGPDNNPQSRDRIAKGELLTQFLCEPWYVPMPQVTVASGGRIFKAFGHIALKQREWPWLNKLVALNGYNGTLLWKRDLKPGFMIHRNTMIATPDTVYLADDTSCKLLDAATGTIRDEIVISNEYDSDGAWKWMALDDGILYALVGPKEAADTVIRGRRIQPGWPWSSLGKAYGGEYPWGFGRTVLAIDPKTKRVLWNYTSREPIDSRAMCKSGGQIYVYSHQKYLAGLDASSGIEIWKTSNERTLAAIGQNDRAQTASKGFASSAYLKANQHGLYFAGPQRTKLAAVSSRDGSLMWEFPHGNFQLVLRDDALYAMGRTQTSKKFDYETGQVLADLACYRGNCTRATGTVDSIFTRGYRHTGTMRLDVSGNTPRRIPLMRPACQDGVIVAHGQFYWGPWMCDCNHSLVGMISLAPAGDFDFAQKAAEAKRLEISQSEPVEVAPLVVEPGDWPGYRAGPARTAGSPVAAPEKAERLWQYQPKSRVEPTAPVTAGGLVFWSGLDGTVRAAGVDSGKLRWTAFTGGAVRFPPAIWQGRLLVGSGDGWVYCFEAASGRRLWRFRAAPAERKIAVHGRLLSNWPVGSGVLVSDGVVYAAAGITSYDGTHVYALDAASGMILWQNNTSGRLVDDEQVTGVSVQGHMLLHDGRLYLAGGNVVSPAMYDIKTGECLNSLENEWLHGPPDTKFPSNPREEMFQRSPRGRELFLVDGAVRVFDQLLYSPPKYQRAGYFGGFFLQASDDKAVIRATAGRVVRLVPTSSGEEKPRSLWESRAFSDPKALALCDGAVLVAGRRANGEEGGEAEYRLAALGLEDGKPLWSHPLPAAPVSWGLALDHASRASVTLIDGRVVTFGP